MLSEIEAHPNVHNTTKIHTDNYMQATRTANKKPRYILNSRVSIIYMGWLMGSYWPRPEPSIHEGFKRLLHSIVYQ
jgi:hypothetical protein